MQQEVVRYRSNAARSVHSPTCSPLCAGANINLGQSSPLITACEHPARPSLVSQLLRLHADPRARTKNGGWTALMTAAEHNNTPVLEILLGLSDIDSVDASGTSALLWACISGAADALAMLLEAGANKAIRNDLGEDAMNLTAKKLACRRLLAVKPQAAPLRDAMRDAPRASERKARQVHCFCGKHSPDGLGSSFAVLVGPWLQCSKCERWCHAACAGLTTTEAEELSEYICVPCIEPTTGASKMPDGTKQGAWTAAAVQNCTRLLQRTRQDEFGEDVFEVERLIDERTICQRGGSEKQYKVSYDIRAPCTA